MTKQFLFDTDARAALQDGIDALANAASVTLGPKGRNVALDVSWGSPTITSDGHSIVKDIELKDPFLNMGASIAKEALAKIKEKVGDGTTTGLVLLRALVRGGVKNIAAGASPIAIKRGMEKALEELLRKIDAMAVEIKNEKQTQNVAASAAGAGREIGETIAACFAKVGKTGVVQIEEGKGIETTIEMTEGMLLDRGYLSAYFCTDQEKLSVEMEYPLLLITDKKISSAQEILPILQHVAASSQELLIIADDLEGDALSTLVVNKLRGTLKVAAIKAPGFGDQRKALLEDIAILTGAELISEEKGLLLKEAGPGALGRADRILIQKDKTTFVGGKGTAAAIKARIAQLTAEHKRADSKYDQEKLAQRKAKLQGGVAVIKVGAPTESELKKKKQLFEDSLHSTRSALEGGIVPGGGMALLRASLAVHLKLSEEEKIGYELLLKACEAPFRQIAANAGFDPSVLLSQVLSQKETFGFNAVSEKIEDLMACGVIDPATVVKSVLSHAVSAAGVVLLTDALINN